MFVFSPPFRSYASTASVVLLLQMGDMLLAKGSGSGTPVVEPVTVAIWTDRAKYSLPDTVELSVSLQNNGGPTVYVDRRMFWGGLGGGLQLEISDDKGRSVPSRILADAIMPPPIEGDMSILIRLDEGFFYGTGVELPVKDTFPKTGRYALRVVYKSWLRRETVPPGLRDLHGIWADSRPIASNVVWIDVAE